MLMLAQYANTLSRLIKEKTYNKNGFPSYHIVYKELRVTVNASQVVSVGKDAEYSVFLLEAGVL